MTDTGKPQRDDAPVRRIVFQVRSGHPSEVALEAAMRIARAFHTEIEGLFVEDSELLAMTQFPFSREISSMGGVRREFSLASIERDMRLASTALRRRMEDLARLAEVPLHFRVVRDEPEHAVASLCEACGDRSLVALGEPFSAAYFDVLRRLMSEIGGLAGVAIVGPGAKRMSGPVVAAVEEERDLKHVAVTAYRLARALDEDLNILLIDRDPTVINDFERAAHTFASRLERARVLLAQSTGGEPAVIAETVRRLKGGFVVAPYGGAFVPSEGKLDHLLQAIECPMLLLR